MVPASFDFCLANLNREASSAGTSIPSDSLNPTARFPEASSGRDEMTMPRSSARIRLHREDVVVLVLAGLVRPQASERGRDRR